MRIFYLYILFLCPFLLILPHHAHAIGETIACDDSTRGQMVGWFAPDGGDDCFSGGGQSFCTNYDEIADGAQFLCASAAVTNDDAPTVAWPAFDPPHQMLADMTEEDIEDFYQNTTRDNERGRAGLDNPLYMNQFGVCRMIDNTVGNSDSVFVGVRTPGEWATVHGTSSAAPNAGFGEFADNAALNVDMAVCCSPAIVTICGVENAIEYGPVGTVAMLAAGGGYAEVTCQSNNNWVVTMQDGICGGGPGGGGGANGGGTGYHNPATGGTISDLDAAMNGVPDGYSQVSRDVNTNAQGRADMEAAAAAAEQDVADAEAAAAAAEAAAEAERAAAEAEAQAAEDAANDDDDSNDPGV